MDDPDELPGVGTLSPKMTESLNYSTKSILNGSFDSHNNQTRGETETIVLIQPDDYETQTFFRNDLIIRKALQSSPSQNHGILEVHKNYQKSLLVVKLKGCTTSDTLNLLKISQLGSFKITCRLPEKSS